MADKYAYLLGQSGLADTSRDLMDPEAMPSERDESATGLGPLLEEKSPKKVTAAILKQWRLQDMPLSRVLAEVEQAEAWRAAERWVFIRRANNDRQWSVWRPPGIDRLPPLPDKVDELCRRFTSQLLVDPPSLEAEPMTGEEPDVESAELASKILDADGGESGWNFRLAAEAAIDIATTQKSAFAHVWVDPTGGGEQPVTIMAAPLATAYDEAQPELCTLDPMTGQPSNALVTKYLEQDGQTLTPAETATTMRRWVPRVTYKVLGMRHVRFLPLWCRGLEDASGLIVADFVTIGELKRRYPDTVGTMDPTALRKLVNWKPLEDHDLLPRVIEKPSQYGTWLEKDEVPDDAVALCFWFYAEQSPVYPKGAAVCVAGGEYLLAQDTLEVEVERPDGSKVPEVLEVPVAQCRCINDWVGLSPYGQSLVTKAGPWNEMMAQQWVALQEFLDRLNNPFVFLPIGSSVQPDQLARRDGRPILTNPQGQPIVEQVPDLSPEIGRWYEFATTGLHAAYLLSETANATELPNVNSGVQANTIINQVRVAFSSCQQNASDYLTRLGRLILQRLRAYMTAPQTVHYVGDDASYRANDWRGADLFGAKDVRLARGSFTGMRPDQKRALILQDVQAQVMPLEDAADALAEGSTSQLGLEDDPVRLRIRRQIGAFVEQGAPFDRLPVDMVPAIAHKRFRELAKQMMTTRFEKLASPAKQAFVAEFEAMRQAAGVQTVQEQSQAQQAAQQAEGQKDAMVEQATASAKTQGDIARDNNKARLDDLKMQREAQLEATVRAATPTVSINA